MPKRQGGILPLGDGRVGIPLDSPPSDGWMKDLRSRMACERPTDAVWQHAAQAASADEVEGIPHLVFPIGDISDADFLVTYMAVIDAAVAAANQSDR